MNFCPHCGKKMPDRNTRFCVFCGGKLDSTVGARNEASPSASDKSAKGSSFLALGPKGTPLRKKIFLISIVGIPLVAFVAFAGFTQISDSGEPQVISTVAEISSPAPLDTETGSRTINAERTAISPGLAMLQEAQADIPNAILVPSYLPSGFKLSPSSIRTDKDNQSYIYELKEGSASLGFGINLIGNPNVAWQTQIMEVRGRKALVYYDAAPSSFENSKFFFIEWHEDRDVRDRSESIGAYILDAKSIEWNTVIKIINGLEPAKSSKANIEVDNYLDAIMSKADANKLRNADLSFPILVPSEVPTNANCAVATVGKDNYLIAFAHTGGDCSVDDIFGYNSVGSISGRLVGQDQCSQDMKPDKISADQEVKIGSNPGLYQMGASGYNLLWCDNGVEYTLDRQASVDSALEAANSMETVNQS